MQALVRLLKTIFIATTSTFLVFILLLTLLFWGISKDLKPKKYQPKPHSVLHVCLKGEIIDQSLKDDFLFSKKKKSNLYTLLQSIQHATQDDNIVGLYLTIEDMTVGWAQLEEIYSALQKFKKTGKSMITYHTMYDHKSYYLAALSDHIITHEEGIFFLNGFKRTVYFYKNLLKTLQVEPIVFRVGNFKSAIEPFTRDCMSAESKQQSQQWLNGLYQHFLKKVTYARGCKQAHLDQWIHRLSLTSIQAAKAHHLIDAIVSGENQAKKMAKKKILSNTSVHTLNFVHHTSYAYHYQTKVIKQTKNKVAVLVAKGDIIDGYSTPESIGDKSILQVIKKLAKDDSIKSVVLRIDTPGGSSRASNRIWNALCQLKNKKPIVVSMGNVTASGGYYMAMAADHVVANATSITGSIGVFALFLNPHQLLKNKLKISSDVVKTHPSADMFDFSRTMTPHERTKVQQFVEDNYKSFVQKVVYARKLSLKKVESIASGRVWLGTDAHQHGLVDTIGGLSTAIVEAKKLAKNDQLSVVFYDEKPHWIQFFLNDFSQNIGRYFLAQEKYTTHYRAIMRMQGIQARMHDACV